MVRRMRRWAPVLGAALSGGCLGGSAGLSDNLLGSAGRDVIVTLTEGTNLAAVPSPDGRSLLLALQGGLWMLPIEGGAATRLTGWDVEASWPTWSPDGSRIAFQRYSDSNYHIWTMRQDGKELTQVTHGYFDHREPAWSPDGAQLAFSSDRGAEGSYDIWTLTLVTGAYVQRTDSSSNEHSPSWSPDGARVAYALGRSVLSLDAAGRSEEMGSIPTGNVLAPSWSPDGRTLAWVSAARELMLGGQAQTFGEDVFPFPVHWLPDGRFVYTADGKVRVRQRSGGDPADVAFTAALTVRRPELRFKDHQFDQMGPRPVRGILSPALSPDGGSIAFIALNDLWVMPIGGAARQLTSDRYLDWDPSWSSDGRIVYFASDRHGDGSPDIYSVDVGTGAVTRVSVITDTDVVTPVPSPDERSFAYIGTGQALMIYDVAAGTSRKVVDQAGGSTVGRPTWSANGATIALADLSRINSRYREGYHLIRTVDVTTGAARFVSPGPVPNQIADRVEAGPVWSPDGKWMAFIMNSTLHAMPVDSRGAALGPALRLTDHVADMPSWGGDSRTLLYVSSGSLRTVQVDGTAARTVPFDLSWTQEVPNGRTVIHAGGLWDGVSPTLRRDVDVVVVGNRIEEIRPHRDAPGDRIIDASQLTLMPGLWDAHVHPRTKDSMGQVMGLWLSYGITSVASMGWAPYHTLALEEALDAGRLVGPRLFTSGPLYEGDRVFYSQARAMTDEHVADLEMEKMRALDVDYLKAYVRTPVRLMAKIARTAQDMGVPSGTHFLSPGTEVGLMGITHLSESQRMGYSWSQSGGGRSYQDVMELFARGGVDLTSTHFSIDLIGADPGILEDRRVALLMPEQYMPSLVNSARTPVSEARRASMTRAAEMAATLVREGGLVALGTDTPLAVPALSLHMALRAFGFGMTNHAALQTATIDAARFLGVGDQLGTVEPGKIADLVAVRGNPLVNLGDAANVELVMKNGIVFTIDDILRPFGAAVTSGAQREH